MRREPPVAVSKPVALYQPTPVLVRRVDLDALARYLGALGDPRATHTAAAVPFAPMAPPQVQEGPVALALVVATTNGEHAAVTSVPVPHPWQDALRAAGRSLTLDELPSAQR